MNLSDLSPDLVKAHLIFQKVSRYPSYISRIRELFVKVLEERGVATPEELEAAARKVAEANGLTPQNPALVEEYLNAVIDICFASVVDLKEAENYVNLAPKLAKNRQLARLLHWENASSREIFKLLEEFCLIPQGDMFIPEAEAVGVRVALINHFISNQLPYVGIAKKHVTIRDVYYILQRTVWNPDRSGPDRRQGGRDGPGPPDPEPPPQGGQPQVPGQDRRGRLLLHPPPRYSTSSSRRTGWRSTTPGSMRPGRRLRRSSPRSRRSFAKARYSEETLQGFRYILEKLGEVPIIPRSSSFLEDNFGLAFSGKYESVFLANQGDLETRLRDFVQGIKYVHMSTYHPAPILYRRDHNLLDFNEHMSVLVQRVIGQRHGDYFFPLAAGVVFSVNSFSWNPKIDRQAGLLGWSWGWGPRPWTGSGPVTPGWSP